MAQFDKNIEKLSPDSLMTHFTSSKVVLSIILAVVVHMGVIGATSVSYIRDVMDPEGAKLRQEQAEAAREAALAAANPAPPKPAAPANTEPTTQPASPATTSTATTPSATSNYDNSPMKQRLEEVAKPDELPGDPGLGISIDDTNPVKKP